MNLNLQRPVASDELIAVGDTADVVVVWYVAVDRPRTPLELKLLKDTFDWLQAENIAVVFRPYAQTADGDQVARALVAAGRQNRFYPFVNQILERSEGLTAEELLDVARHLGLDTSQFTSHLDDLLTTSAVQDNKADVAATRKGHTTLFIHGRRYDGVWDGESVREAIRKPLGYRVHEASRNFFRWATSAGLVLMLATIAALAFVNAGFHEHYEHARELPVGFRFGEWDFELPLEQWVNDALMAVFFLLVGIEIKRELVNGELASLSQAALPIVGALGGMMAPALIYGIVNFGSETASGWGIPMATDIAFTLGLMVLLGERVPASLKVFVSALAIADDLGAIVVIAVFYGEGFHVMPFLGSLCVLVLMIALNRGRVYSVIPYLLLGTVLWFLVHESGLHATLAGVLTALAIPSRKSGNLVGVAAQAAAIFHSHLDDAQDSTSGGHEITTDSLHRLKSAVNRLKEPGLHLQHAIENWTNYLILPLFAFFNMGVMIMGAAFEVTAPASLGIILGLCLGKPLGIVFVCWLAVRFGVARLPEGVSWTQMVGAGCLAGVGFTMSIFIATAAFEQSQLQGAKLSILIASTLSAVSGMAVLAYSCAAGHSADPQAE